MSISDAFNNLLKTKHYCDDCKKTVVVEMYNKDANLFVCSECGQSCNKPVGFENAALSRLRSEECIIPLSSHDDIGKFDEVEVHGLTVGRHDYNAFSETIDSIKIRTLNEHGESLKSDFELNFSDVGCTCHCGHPPCSYCTHPGHPTSLEETQEAWDEVSKPNNNENEWFKSISLSKESEECIAKPKRKNLPIRFAPTCGKPTKPLYDLVRDIRHGALPMDGTRHPYRTIELQSIYNLSYLYVQRLRKECKARIKKATTGTMRIEFLRYIVYVIDHYAKEIRTQVSKH